MKSEKRIKELNEIISPFLFKPNVTVEGSVNGKKFFYLQDKTHEISYAEYEVIWHSNYGKELAN